MTISEAACPRCGEMTDRHRGAISRVDDKTLICSFCGTKEGLWVYTYRTSSSLPPLDQPVVVDTALG